MFGDVAQYFIGFFNVRLDKSLWLEEGCEQVGRCWGKVQCRFCPLLLSCADARKEHEKMHGQKGRKFRCAYCCLSSDAKFVVSKHEKIHIGEQPLDRTNEPISQGTVR